MIRFPRTGNSSDGQKILLYARYTRRLPRNRRENRLARAHDNSLGYSVWGGNTQTRENVFVLLLDLFCSGFSGSSLGGANRRSTSTRGGAMSTTSRRAPHSLWRRHVCGAPLDCLLCSAYFSRGVFTLDDVDKLNPRFSAYSRNRSTTWTN